MKASIIVASATMVLLAVAAALGLAAPSPTTVSAYAVADIPQEHGRARAGTDGQLEQLGDVCHDRVHR